MILICPSCETRYVTSDDSIGATGRNVRCAACDHSWYVKPAETLGDPSEVQDESGLTRAQVERLRQKAVANAKSSSGPHAEMREKELKRRKRNQLIAIAAAWSGSALVFVGSAYAALNNREAVVSMMPEAASVYEALGMEVNRFGLDFAELQAQRSFDGTTPVLTISGKAVNSSDRHRPSPTVRIGLYNQAGAEVHVERVNLMDAVVPPSGEANFTAHIISPPMDSYDVQVSFEIAGAYTGASGHVAPVEGHDAANDEHHEAPVDHGAEHATQDGSHVEEADDEHH